MRIILLIFTVQFLPNLVTSLKILQFVHGVSSSLLLFNYRLANASASQGHNVTLWTGLCSNLELKDLYLHPGVKEIRIDMRNKDYVMGTSAMDAFIWQPFSIKILREIGASMIQRFIRQCRFQYEENLDLLEKLREEHFDVAITHSYSLCPFAIAYKLGIAPENTVIASAGSYIPENSAYFSGILTTPSVMPATMSSNSDYMTFFQRMGNFAWVAIQFAYMETNKTAVGMEIDMFQEPPDSDFPSLASLAQRVAGILINGEEYLDFPRPLPYGAYYLGALGKKLPTTHDSLPQMWKDILNKENKGIILLSFGTVANTSSMPQPIANALLGGVKELTDYSIIWKYKLSDLPEIADYPHITTVSWLPQRKLLQSERTKLFITHGGYNSLLETTKAGKPMLLCPLFWDQYANAMRAVRYGLGEMIDVKDQSFDAKLLHTKITTILDDETYSKKAKKLAGILNEELVPVEKALAHKLRQIARKGRNSFQTLAKANRLNFFQYYCIDVIVFWLGVVIFALCCIIKIYLTLYKRFAKA